MYRCQICDDVVPPRQPRLAVVVQRVIPASTRCVSARIMGVKSVTETKPEHREIEREIPACRRCYNAVERGESIENLREAFRKIQVESLPEPILPVWVNDVFAVDGEELNYRFSQNGDT